MIARRPLMERNAPPVLAADFEDSKASWSSCDQDTAYFKRTLHIVNMALSIRVTFSVR